MEAAKTIPRIAGLAAALLFAVSLFLPVAVAQQTQGPAEIGGFGLLFIGPMGALMGQFGWWATPCLIAAIVLLTRSRSIARRTSLILASAMLAFLIDAFFWRNYPNDGGDGPISAFESGYYLWILAVLIGAGGLLFSSYRQTTDLP